MTDRLSQLHVTRTRQRLPKAVRRSLQKPADNYTRWTFTTSAERNEKYRQLREAMACVKNPGIVKYSDASGYVVAVPRLSQ